MLNIVLYIKRLFGFLNNWGKLSEKSLEKYVDERKGEYNFLDVVSRIKLTEMQIQEQQRLLLSKRRQMPLLLTLFSCLMIYLPKILVSFAEFVWYEYVIVALYFLLLILSAIFFYLTIFPKKMPHRYLPRQFYEDIFDDYKSKGYDDIEANKGTQYTYLDYLEQILIQYLNCVGNIEKWFTRFMVVFPWAILFYVVSIIFVFSKSSLDDNFKNKQNMVVVKKVFVPSETIKVKPILVKEGVEIHYSTHPKSVKRDSLRRFSRIAKSATNGMRYSK